MDTMRDYCKISRGQVWFLPESKADCFNKIKDANNFVIAKARPWLIISVNNDNFRRFTVTCLPLTTHSFDRDPCHVYFRQDTRDTLIECDQIFTKSITEFSHNMQAYYMFTLSDFLMDKVSRALARHCGYDYQIKGYQELEDLITELVVKSQSELKNQDVDNIITGLCASIKKTISETQNETETIPSEDVNVQTEPEKHISQVEKFKSKWGNRPISKTESVKVISSKESKEKNRMEWTQQLKDQFIKDSKTMSIDELQKKYHYGRSSIYRYIKLFKDEI